MRLRARASFLPEDPHSSIDVERDEINDFV
jgi:hypothetical protein